MPLSDKEIKELLEKAEYYGNPSNASCDTRHALKLYDRLIEAAPPNSFYFRRRANIKWRLSSIDSAIKVDSAIEDLSRAIELNPDEEEYYDTRGEYLLSKLSKEKNISDSDKNQLLEKALTDYKTSVEKNPPRSRVWLNLIELNILLCNWDDAISVYGSCKPYITSKEDRLTRSWLGCLALTFAGDTISEEDEEPLYDRKIQEKGAFNIRRTTALIKSFQDKEDFREKCKKAIEIQKLFIDHVDDWSVKAFELFELECYEEALKAYEKAIMVKPNNSVLWGMKVEVLKELGYREEALKAYEKLIALKPNNVRLWLEKAKILNELDRYEEALKALNKARALDKAASSTAPKKSGQGNSIGNFLAKFIK